MTDYINDQDVDMQKVPSGINVLSILTFIGCAIGLIFSVIGFFSAKTSYDKKDETMEKMYSADAPAFVKAMLPSKENFDAMTTKNFENRVPILLLSIVSLSLCFVGALQMRKRKKQGFLLYVIGQLLPFITSAVFIGLFALTGMSFYVITFFTLLFLLLYTMQRKHLVY
jgi:hypothetical protein